MILMVTNGKYFEALERCRSERRAIFAVDVTHHGYELTVSDPVLEQPDLLPDELHDRQNFGRRRMACTDTPSPGYE